MESTDTLTAQNIFDLVAVHLFTQGKRAWDEVNHLCKYRTKEGLKCAVGCLIPDSVYHPRIEGRIAEDVINGYSGLSNLKPYTSLLNTLQYSHDNVRNWENTRAMKKSLKHVAASYALNSGILEGLTLKSA